jgi:hypothetical protein
MRAFVIAIGALLVVAGAALPAAAQTQPKQPKADVKKEPAPRAAAQPRGDGYRERLVDKLPYGSQAWWDQMSLEGRLGTDSP